MRPRQIIEEIEDLGFEAELQPDNDSIDIRELVKGEVIKYRKRLIAALLMYLPIAIFIWMVPYVDPMMGFMTNYPIYKGNTLYILIIMILSTIIQFTLGYHFYISAYKSVKHKSANMDVLIVLGTTSAWIYGIIKFVIGYTENQQQSMEYMQIIHNHVHNFETASILILIVTVGKFIEAYSKMKTVDKLSDLA